MKFFGKGIDSLFRLKEYFRWYFDISDDVESKESIIATIKAGVSFRGTTIMILIIAMFIASLGLNVNSAAVIIGAMLISPLMGPIMGMGLGIGILDYQLIKRSFRNLAMAALFSIIASTLYFLISPLSDNSSELLARTSPSIYDVLIAFFGGCAGILAVSSKQKGNVLPGVAIATALMPPLCTAGYGLATWQLSYFIGAFFLFLINSIFIGLATSLGVRLMKLPRVVQDGPRQTKRVTRIVTTIIILTLVPSVYLTVLMLRENYFKSDANKFIDKEFVFPNTQVLNRSAEIRKGQKVIHVTLIGQSLPLDSLKVAMYAKMQESGLGGTQLEIEQGFAQNSLDVNKLGRDMFSDIYNSGQQRISALSHEVDSLNSVLAKQRDIAALPGQVAAELKVLFPEVEALSISSNVFAKSDSTVVTDTVNMAILTLKRNLTSAQEEKLVKFLEVRSGLRNIELVRYRSARLFAQPEK